MQAKLSHVNRAVAAILAFVWAVGGIAGLLAAYVYGRWELALGGLFGLWYAVLWVRVFVRGRLLTWRQIVMPWRLR